MVLGVDAGRRVWPTQPLGPARRSRSANEGAAERTTAQGFRLKPVTRSGGMTPEFCPMHEAI